MHEGKNHICQGRFVAQEEYKGLLLAHSLSSLRTSSLIKIQRGAWFPPSSWLVGKKMLGQRRRRKEAICLLGPMPKASLRIRMERSYVCVVSSKHPSQGSGAGNPCRMGPGHGVGLCGSRSSFNTSTSPLTSWVPPVPAKSLNSVPPLIFSACICQSHPWVWVHFFFFFLFFFFCSTTLLLPIHLPPPSCTHAQSCNPMDCSPPGSSVHGFLQARILEWVAISFSMGPFFHSAHRSVWMPAECWERHRNVTDSNLQGVYPLITEMWQVHQHSQSCQSIRPLFCWKIYRVSKNLHDDIQTLSPAFESSQSAISNQLQPHSSSSSITLPPLIQPVEHHQRGHASGSLPILYSPPLVKFPQFLQCPAQRPISPPLLSSNSRKFWLLFLLCFQNIGCRYSFQHLQCYYIYLYMFIFPIVLWALWR